MSGGALPLRVILGAGDQRWPGWQPTQRSELDLLDPDTFARFFGGRQADAFLCEHVWEHLEPGEGRQAARLVARYLNPGGFLRVAVPDGHHPEPSYQALVAPGGPGPAADHRVLYTLETFAPLFTAAGLKVRPLEWWDRSGTFHRAEWQPADAPVYRSSHLDHRNESWRQGRGPLGFTSLVLDAVRP
ncbi:class I SAM-dependent methyltransferase [Deinococcus navajonensis]|uniref:Class I SAM-dependent methyltransferase n=1 Tax=Deinococcus navajonensis TaxID=309884 RepID=A0ABV8XPX0_9DEIO